MLREARRRQVLPPALWLHVAVGERLLGVHSDAGEVGRQVVLRHPGPALLGRQMLVGGLLWGVDRVVVVDAVVAGRGLRRVQASLESVCQRRRDACDAGFCAYLNQVLALGLGDQRLQLRGGEGVDETGF